jgi:15-cis-phytoene desaturase
MQDINKYSRRTFVKVTAVGIAGVSLSKDLKAMSLNNSSNEIVSIYSPQSYNKKVCIIGGGVSGLCAAHLLMEKGYQVEVFEKRSILGGKARSYHFQSDKLHENLPAEHGFRYFPGFYRHVTEIMKRIPYKNRYNGVYSNLVHASSIQYLRHDNTPLNIPIGNITGLSDIKELLNFLFNEEKFDLRPGELKFFASKIYEIARACQQRRDEEYDQISWWDFIDADKKSKAYQDYLGVGLCNSLVAMKAQMSSTRTVGVLFFQLLLTQLRPYEELDRLLNGPTNEVWIHPWIDHLKKNGVKFHEGHKLTRIKLNNSKDQVSSLVFESDVSWDESGFDYYLLSLPQNYLLDVLPETLLSFDPGLERIRNLKDEWMVGIQLYFSKKLNINDGHMIFINSPWSLTSIHQAQYWREYDFDKHSQVQDILSLCISDWNRAGVLYNKPAKECTREEVFQEVWHQINLCLADKGEELLDQSTLLDWHLDQSVHFNDKGATYNEDPLFINTIGSLKNRPDAKTKINNMFITGDYIKTQSDLACMESAAESSYLAVNHILTIDERQKDLLPIYPLREPVLFKPAKLLDYLRYRS